MQAPGSASRFCCRAVTQAACSGPGAASTWLAAEAQLKHMPDASLPSLVSSLALGLQAAAGESAEAFADRAAQLLTGKAEMLQECMGLGIDQQGALQPNSPHRHLHGWSKSISLPACAHESRTHVMPADDEAPASCQSVDCTITAGRTCQCVAYGCPCSPALTHAVPQLGAIYVNGTKLA